jgi:hypothetical protein
MLCKKWRWMEPIVLELWFVHSVVKRVIKTKQRSQTLIFILLFNILYHMLRQFMAIKYTKSQNTLRKE